MQTPTLKFIADMNISPLTVSQLKENGWDIVRVSEVMDVRTSDLDILDYAGDEGMIVISHDLDFSELLAVHGYSRPSVINLRLGDVELDFVTQRIVDVVSQLEAELRQGIVVSVDDTSARYRNLPI